ncbi:MAG: 5-formyltetrahydrofolate cyclo-ligase [Lachnospiraceae bacterium]|nr:5-formyltetrahydrofolate cyclo-ligase [Lachnospiraceae bacterium]
MEQTKREIRERALALRDALLPAERAAYSKEIIDKITRLDCYRNAAALLVYVSFRSEVETGMLIENALVDKKAVFSPVVSGREMEFFRITSLNELKSGYQGILEPAQEAEASYREWMRQKEISSTRTLLCMPGAAFDRERNRIGYGGGYYDRYLSALSAEQEKRTENIETIALAFSCQIFAEIPREPHDLRPDRIVTEREIIAERNGV